MIEMSKERRFLGKTRLAKPAGDQQIVLNDKVIQTVNERRKAWSEEAKTEATRYVANGEVGLVTWTQTLQGGGEQLQVVFGTQRGHRFKYWSGQVDERLELAYGITVHKSQGSDFETVFLVLPQSGPVAEFDPAADPDLNRDRVADGVGQVAGWVVTRRTAPAARSTAI